MNSYNCIFRLNEDKNPKQNLEEILSLDDIQASSDVSSKFLLFVQYASNTLENV